MVSSRGRLIGLGALVAVLVVGAFVVARVVGARRSGPARSPVDRTYLAAAQAQFPNVDAADLISLGHAICTTFQRNPDDVHDAEDVIAGAASRYPQVPPDHLISVMRAAIADYCPQVQAVFGAQATTTTDP